MFNILLQVLEDGILTDGQGRRVDFRHTIIIMTSNVGAKLINQEKVMGFRPGGEDRSYEEMKEQVMNELKRTFRPEFLNRIDDVIVFHALEREHIHRVDLMLAELAGKLKVSWKSPSRKLPENSWWTKDSIPSMEQGLCAALFSA